jgi:AcrR family transcriptional regulator
LAGALSRHDGPRVAGKRADAARRVDERPLAAAPFKKLKPGPGLSAEAVARDQRQRLRDALVRIVSTSGPEGLTVRAVSALAGVSTRTFYERFSGTEECFEYAYESTVQSALGRARSASSVARGRRANVEWVIHSLYASLAAQPTDAELVLIAAYGAGVPVRRRLKETLAELGTSFEAALGRTSSEVAVTPHLLAGFAAGTLAIARRTVMARRAAELPALSGEVSNWVLSLLCRDILDLRPGGASPSLSPADVSRTPGGADSNAGPRRSNNPRGRILDAAARLVADSSYSALSIPAICMEAGLSRREFDLHFATLEECFLDAVETLSTLLIASSVRSAQGLPSWEDRVRATVEAICVASAESPPNARIVFAEVLEPGTAGVLRRETLLSRLADGLTSDARLGRDRDPIATAASLSAVWQIVHSEVCAGRTKSLPALAPILSFVVTATDAGPR